MSELPALKQRTTTTTTTSSCDLRLDKGTYILREMQEVRGERRKEREMFYFFLIWTLICHAIKMPPFFYVGPGLIMPCRPRRRRNRRFSPPEAKMAKNDSKAIDAAPRIGGGAAAASLRQPPCSFLPLSALSICRRASEWPSPVGKIVRIQLGISALAPCRRRPCP